ncbi:hypothetical protein SMKI_14G2730 [Saccharomyces mikatae IFO 1815]|uniref:YNL046W-like protein n=1 Tax=Saccharomyces mikatae IFO 1815 TaxID=226126 RepID=A0AA35ISE6_SACMI|nr:uncharacterized protein SMKI_14G2730 [Saccharomyces mikatae IFO 1815]CAI4036057.1 hypothetical protein SMKI_14G2730 [Saccharomyces mikatae IFO 1815]
MPKEHVPRKSFGKLFKSKATAVDGNRSQDTIGTANRLRKLLCKSKIKQQLVPAEPQCRIPGHFRDGRKVQVEKFAYNGAPQTVPSTLNINKRYVHYDISTKPLIVMLAISIVFLGCLLVLKDIIIQSSQNILSISKWKIIGASFTGTPYTGLLMELVVTVLSPLSAVSSWLSFIF